MGNKQLISVAYGEGDIETYSISQKGNIAKNGKKKSAHSFITTAVVISEDQTVFVSGSVDRTIAINPILSSSMFFIAYM